MKGNPKIIERLNARLSEELAAVNQYMVHSEMNDDWGYEKLHKLVEKRAIDEMKHAEKLIGRILFLEGQPVVSNLAKIHIGADAKAQLESDRDSETEAIRIYNEDIKAAADLGDYGTRDLLQSILLEEEAHLDWIETQLEQISQLGIQNYLVEQTS